MKIVEINSVCGVGSTGKICVGIAEVAKSHGYECKIAYGRKAALNQNDKDVYRITSDFQVKVHALLSRLFGKSGTYSKRATKKFIAWLNEYKPNVIHLHNLHGYYINVPMLFDYIKANDVKVIWTLHDCWAFTGHCAYFDEDKCTKWKNGCNNCPSKSAYPKSLRDDSCKMYRLKKQWFSGVKDMRIVTPSRWLEKLVKQSFLSCYETTVINNGIDLQVFKPYQSNFKLNDGFKDKFIILGVAGVWDDRKGLEVFAELSKRLDERFKIVLVGVGEAEQKNLPDNILVIKKTENARQLAEIYSAADLFVNPTKQENFPTVNIEALACGTPVLTFETGGSTEIIDQTCGASVPKNDVDGLVEKIEYIYKNKPFTSSDCVKRAQQYDAEDKFKEYLSLYNAQYCLD